MRKTKAICTIRPADRSPDELVHVIQTGMAVARCHGISGQTNMIKITEIP